MQPDSEPQRPSSTTRVMSRAQVADKNALISQLLLESCAAGRHAAANQALTAGADPNQAWPGGIRPLHLAAHRGDIILTKLLLQQGADVNAKTLKRETSAYIAATGGHDVLLRILAQHGADFALAEVGGLTPLHIAMLKRRFDTAEVLLWLGAPPSLRTVAGLAPDALVEERAQPPFLRRLFAAKRLSGLRQSVGEQLRAGKNNGTIVAAPQGKNLLVFRGKKEKA